jgi:hypothetical protein
MTKGKRSAGPAPDAALSFRVPADLIDRADALIPHLATEAVAQGFTRVSRSVVVKRALAEGLAVLERKYAGRSR